MLGRCMSVCVGWEDELREREEHLKTLVGRTVLAVGRGQRGRESLGSLRGMRQQHVCLGGSFWVENPREGLRKNTEAGRGLSWQA